MMQFGLIGIGAGAAAALLFASVTSGAWLSIPLFYLAPLPIMIAGLGWSHWSAMTAALVGALALGIAFGPVFFFSFLAGAGLPAWWLGYLAMLARPAGNGAAALEWYPPGRLVVWSALLGGLVVIVAIPNFGLDVESFRAGLRDALTHILHVETGTPAGAPLGVPGEANSARLIDFLVAAIPPAAAVLVTITNVLNLWFGSVIVKFSGRLKRPWPPLAAMTFPRAVTCLPPGSPKGFPPREPSRSAGSQGHPARLCRRRTFGGRLEPRPGPGRDPCPAAGRLQDVRGRALPARPSPAAG